jgi:hypothetical protein
MMCAAADHRCDRRQSAAAAVGAGPQRGKAVLQIV